MVVGARLGDRYTLTRLIGTGGMASVWAAHDPRLEREVAIKVISDTLALDATFVERFAREARIAAALAHPHVVSVFDYGAHGGRPYLVMEYVAGGTLSARLKDGRRDWDPATLTRELLDALGYIHAAGILHRDLKPANVLVGADGRARLTDFGIAHLADGTKLTSTGYVVGTEKYLAPEVRRGGAPTVVADLHGLGVLLRECGVAEAGPVFAALIDRLTDPDPARRPRSAADALALLDRPAGPGPDPGPTVPMPVGDPAPTEALLAPTEVAPTEAYPPPDAPAGRRPARGAAVAAVLVVGAVLLGGAALLSGDDGSDGLRTPPAGGSVSEQLDQLDEAIDRARR
ncbi:hypothetical protein GCM10009547_21850 [Sporichthya brevicatena]|uniref:non-specific serine/threonine protein kinase n=1 Tax=Sporichthya brevicatena TaxID=171442 RepID=A0ABN1GTG6_9ACTN